MTRFARLVSVGLLLLLPFFAAGCTSEPLPDAVFDVPSLVGKDINGVEQTLGKPTQFTPVESVPHPNDVKEWHKIWEKDNKTLLVTYRLSDSKIIDFFIPTDDSKRITNNQDRLLALGKLTRDDARYRIEFMPAPEHLFYYTGVKVTPR